MRRSGDAPDTQPVPWAGGSGERVARPRWLDSASAAITENPFDSTAPPGSSVMPPSNGDRPIGERSAALERSLHAAMAGAALEPMVDAPTFTAPTRDYEGELASMAAELAAVQQQLAAMASSADRVHKRLLESCEADVVELAATLAEKVVGRELKTDAGRIASWAKQALAALADQSELTVIVSPDVFAAVPPEAWRDAEGRVFVPRVDAKLAAGSCDIQSKVSRIDGSATARIRAVVESLGVTEER